MTTELRQYDPVQVVGSWATPVPGIGVIDIVNGAVAGEFLATGKDNARWTREPDLFGNTTRVKNNNRGGTVTITLSASSPTNERLTQAAIADDITENVVGALVLRDLNGNTIIEADGAFLEDEPDVSFGVDRGSRTWVFQCSAIRRYVGGRELA